jgi:hypothetical protein
MFELKYCHTREHGPQDIAHWLSTLQNSKKALHWIFKKHGSKIHIYVSENIEAHLPGVRCLPAQVTLPKLDYHLWQKNGPLLPIKRPSQFEDRLEQSRSYPLHVLLQSMLQEESSCLVFKLQSVKPRKQKRWIQKAKSPHYKAIRPLDQWESRSWISWSLRALLTPLLRHALPKSQEKSEEHTQSQHEREAPRQAMLDKLSRPLFITEVASSHSFKKFFHSFNLPYLGNLEIGKKASKLLFSSEELAALLSPPHPKQTAKLLNLESSAYYPANTDTLSIPIEDRKRHCFILGKTGTGKSSALIEFYRFDQTKNGSILVLDPHGDLTTDLCNNTLPEREKDLLILDPSQRDYPLALNPVECDNHEEANLKASALLEMFERLAKGSWGPRLEHILRNALLSLLQSPNTTLLDLPRLLTNPNFCKQLTQKLKDFELRRFWNEEFLNQDKRTQQEHSASILNKVGPLLSSPILRNIFGQPRSKLKLDTLLHQNKILLINLSKGKLGEDVSRMLGMIFLAMLQSSLLRRAALAEDERSYVSCIIDECQNFSTPTLLSMLAESRKYGLALSLANQYLDQHSPEVQAAILGNAGSKLVFRCSHQDASLLAPSLGLTEEDLTQIDPFHAYASFLKDNKVQPLARVAIPKPKARSELPMKAALERSQKKLWQKAAIC